MKVLVFGGAGKMGSAVAYDLVKEEDVEIVGITGRRRSALEKTKKWIGSSKIKVQPLDIMDKKATKKLMSKYDVGVIALPDRRTSYKVLEAAVEEGFSLVDMLEEYHRRPDAYEVEGLQLPKGMSLNEYGDWLHEKALETGTTFLDGIGFAPGLSNITLGEAIRKLDKTEVAIARVGGIPEKTASFNHPLRYMITWAFWHVLREYNIKVNVIKNGKIVEVDATSDREAFRFNKFGKDEELECAITPGMPSFIFSRPQLKEFAEKTIRWPGHWAGIATLKECGLLDINPIKFQNHKIVPRDFLLALIEPRLYPKEGETDVCVMYNTAIGYRGGKKIKISYYMWDEADKKLGMSSMARVTGFPAAIGALFIGRGLIKEKGIVPPEDAIYGKSYKIFMQELEKRNINILEEEEEI
jgi:saccharopine dehydrogenase-like NADP-dependent oxidoreductase